MSQFVARGWCVCLMAVFLLGSAWLALPAAAQSAADQRDDDPFSGDPAGAKPGNAQNDRTSEAKIRDALGKPTTMEFIETPLQEVVDYLKDLHGIEIQLDTKPLEEAGMGTDSAVTRTLTGISLGSALRLMLRDMGLTTIVRDGMLLITTPAAVSEMVEVRVYDVRDLAKDEERADDLAEILRLALEPERHAASSVRRTGGIGASTAAAVASDSPTKPAPIVRAPAAEIASYGNLVIVRASIAEQTAVDELLAEMREKLKSRAK